MGMFKNLVTEICQLYEQGMDAVRIARLLNIIGIFRLLGF